ncbi:3857_t:CDS:2, partial [Dentiscutata heterogama]
FSVNIVDDSGLTVSTSDNNNNKDSINNDGKNIIEIPIAEFSKFIVLHTFNDPFPIIY